MKSAEEIAAILNDEIIEHLDEIKTINKNLVYYNDRLGHTSFLLAGLLQSILEKTITEWDKTRWIDDSLISNVDFNNNKLTLTGTMIWGKKNTTEQWTDPFSFETHLLNHAKIKDFTFLFSYLDKHEITYEQFKANRNYWTTIKKKWKYVINFPIE